MLRNAVSKNKELKNGYTVDQIAKWLNDEGKVWLSGCTIQLALAAGLPITVFNSTLQFQTAGL